MKSGTSINTNVHQESIFTEVGPHQLHMKRYFSNPNGRAVWMIHGSIENGHIFYSKNGKGLAPFLAIHGYDVFVADLRGRGKSTPPINSSSSWGLKENLEEDFPAYLNKIKEIKGERPIHWMAHSFGGVLQLAFLARYSSPLPVASLTFFGTKRRIETFSLGKLLQVDVVWDSLSRLLVKKYGYLPSKQMRMGSDNETKLSHRETNQWVKEKYWLDWRDGFDYGKALRQQKLPPALYLTGSHDKVLGTPTDVQQLMQETGADNAVIQVVGKKEGFNHNYDHISLLTHPAAPDDHFQMVLGWLRSS